MMEVGVAGLHEVGEVIPGVGGAVIKDDGRLAYLWAELE